jgi:NAD(P)H-flavin reductase
MKNARRGRIIANEDLRGGFRLLRLEAPEIARDSVPGQFVLLKGQDAGWPYLKRPFSVYATDGEAAIEIVYRVVGRATSVMAATAAGEYDLLGPLGNGFAVPVAGLKVIALAGGAGLPPVAFYCQKYGGILDRLTLVIGARTRRALASRPTPTTDRKARRARRSTALLRHLGTSGIAAASRSSPAVRGRCLPLPRPLAPRPACAAG